MAPADLPQPTTEAIDASAKSALRAVPGNLVYRASPEGAQLKVGIDLVWSPPPASLLRAEVTVRLLPRAGDPAMTRVERAAAVEKEAVSMLPSEADVRAHIDHALGITVTAAVQAEQLWLGPPALVRAALDDADVDLRDDAIRFSGEHKDREAVPRLIAFLKSENGELRDRAVGALAEIGDPRAVKPLAELAKFGDLRELPKIIDAVSRVGGDEAVAYLEFIAGSHPVPEVQALAARALEHLRNDAKMRSGDGVKTSNDKILGSKY